MELVPCLLLDCLITILSSGPGPACLFEVACKTAQEDVCTVAKLSPTQSCLPNKDRCLRFLDAWTRLLPSSGYGLFYSRRSKTSILRYRESDGEGEEGQQRIKLPASYPSCLHLKQ